MNKDLKNIAESKNEDKDTKNKLNEAQTELNSQKNIINKYKQNNDELIKENKSLKEKNELLDKENSNKNKLYDELNQRNKDLDNILKQNSKDIESKNDLINKYKIENDELIKKQNSLEEQIKKNDDITTKKVKIINDNRDSIEKKLNKQIEEKDKELNEIKEKNNNLNNLLKSKENDNKKILDNLNKLRNSLSLNEKMEKDFNNILNQKEEEIKFLKKELDKEKTNKILLKNTEIENKEKEITNKILFLENQSLLLQKEKDLLKQEKEKFYEEKKAITQKQFNRQMSTPISSNPYLNNNQPFNNFNNLNYGMNSINNNYNNMNMNSLNCFNNNLIMSNMTPMPNNINMNLNYSMNNFPNINNLNMNSMNNSVMNSLNTPNIINNNFNFNHMNSFNNNMANKNLINNGMNYNNNNINQLNSKTVPNMKNPIDNQSPALVGLNNIGATCFMNATLQCLSQIGKLSQYFLNPKNNADIINNNIAKQNKYELQLCPVYSELIQHLWNKNEPSKSYSPKNFVSNVEKMNPLFQLGQAGDSKDFIIFILEQLHRELKKPCKNYQPKANSQLNQYERKNAYDHFEDEFKKELSIISDLFFGIQETRNECTNCRYISGGHNTPICYNFQIFNCLIFPLKEVLNYRNQNSPNNIGNNNSVNIDDCFLYNQKTEMFTGDNKNHCNLCNNLYDSFYTSYIFCSPNILIFILNRGKNNIYDVKFDLRDTIDITNYVTIKPQNERLTYNLIGVITHLGYSGPNAHFVASCKSSVDNNWYRFNDSVVSNVNDFKKDVINFGKPYILFYQKSNFK